MNASYAMSEEQYWRLIGQDPYYASITPEEKERLARNFAARDAAYSRDAAYFGKEDDRTHSRKIPVD